MSDNQPLYAIENLVIDLYATTVSVRAVDGVSFNVRPEKRSRSSAKAVRERPS
ncbi:hypothetical protein [Mesorhizobium sp. LSHC414A00]|uniref:hypothetical protein n=1 Tax=Mesorhizobium sp. LSHC414A00 TaxID=1287287 RepID=UPI0004134310|nr:hypothetical protein [Mesorhizobium sp. LSHC414A00]